MIKEGGGVEKKKDDALVDAELTQMDIEILKYCL